MVTDFRSFRLIVPVGTQIVLRSDIVAEQRSLAKGMVGEITKTPYDHTHSYRVKLPDGFELSLHRQDFSILKQVKAGPVGDSTCVLADYNLREHVIYECIVGSRAYGLSHEQSDTDRRGIYLAPVELEWSLFGAPEQLEDREREECYWELKKFIVLALKANPNILECLYTPLIEK